MGQSHGDMSHAEVRPGTVTNALDAGTLARGRSCVTAKPSTIRCRRHHEGMTTPRDTRRKCATLARHSTCDGYGCDACADTGRNPALTTPPPATTAVSIPAALARVSRAAGRPSKIETHGSLILERIRKGMDDHGACERSGVHSTTFERWLARGFDAALREQDGRPISAEAAVYRDFLQEYQDAKHDLHERILDQVGNLVDTMKPAEALAFLERMRKSKWARADTLNVNVEPGGGVPFTERYADTLADLLRGILADLRLTDEQAEQVPVIVERNLRRVSAGEGVAS